MSHLPLLQRLLPSTLGLLAACGGVPAEEQPVPEPIRLILAPPHHERMPEVKGISVPRQLISGVPAPIVIALGGEPGEVLVYTLTPGAQGSSFSPAQGSLTLEEAVRTFTVQHVPPPVSAPTVFTHALEVSNAAGRSTLATFEARVWPPGTRFAQALQTHR